MILLRSLPRSLTRIAPPFLPRLQVSFPIRPVVNQVTNKPGSQTIEHAATNVREEFGNSAADIARSIAGGTLNAEALKPKEWSFTGITKAVASAVSTPYMLWGLAGGLPYVGASATTAYLAHQAGLATSGAITSLDPGVALTVLDQALSVQVTYGAVILSFLGALHWGMEFAGLGGHHYSRRLALGVAPVVWGWSTLALQPTMALIVQWVGFTAMWWADSNATSAGWTPKWYSQYRFYLSLLVGSCIIGSLASISYYGPVAGHGLLTYDLVYIRRARQLQQSKSSLLTDGDLEAVLAPEDAETYVIIKKKQQADDARD